MMCGGGGSGDVVVVALCGCTWGLSWYGLDG